MDVARELRSHLECPICLNVPRIMLMCVNGHNVCTVCMKKLGRDAKCPLGRCDFANPPARNRTVDSLVKSFPFELACMYQIRIDCTFKGTWSALQLHEAACRNLWIANRRR